MEVIQNFECLQASTTGALSANPNIPNEEATASDYFSSPEKLFSAAKHGLANAATMSGLASTVAGGLGYSGVATALNVAASALGSGSHARVQRQRVPHGFFGPTSVTPDGLQTSSSPSSYSVHEEKKDDTDWKLHDEM
jgi:hypothetical protein